MDLLRHFQDRTRAMGIAHGQRVVIGVSGGPDSLALLHLFVQSRESLEIVPMAVHVHHGMRGEAADADAEFVATLAQIWQVDCRVEHVDVPSLAKDRGLSLEEAARKARYTVFSKIAREVGTELLAVAHHADDQAETVLLHLLRGAGLRGLRGMLPVTTLSASHVLDEKYSGLKIIRPLLDVPRDEILGYCEDQGLNPHEDETNIDVGFLRNRVRHTILPALRDVSPHISEQLGQTAHLLQADHDALETQVTQAWNDCLTEEEEGSILFHRDRWKSLPLAIQRGVIRRAVSRLAGSTRNLGFEHVENAIEVGMRGDQGAQAMFPGGLTLTVAYDVLRIAMQGADPTPPDWPLLPSGTQIVLHGMGAVHSAIPDSDWAFVCEPYDGPREGSLWKRVLNDPWQAVIDADILPDTEGNLLLLRTRLPGDRFQPQGVGAAQKLSDFLINAKVPARWRDHLPLLATGPEGKMIVWVCGFRIDARFLVEAATRRVLLLRFDRFKDTASGTL